jgi:hypothetical protein
VRDKASSGTWKLFLVKVAPKTKVLSVTLKGMKGDNLDLFLFSPDAKDTSQARASGKSPISLEGTLIRNPKAGLWKIGVYGSKVRTGNFELVVDTKGRDYVKSGLRVSW